MPASFSLDTDAALRGAAEGVLSAPHSEFGERLVMGLEVLAHQDAIMRSQVTDAFSPWTIESLNALDTIRDGSPVTTFQAYFSHKIDLAPVMPAEPPPAEIAAIPPCPTRRRFWQRLIDRFRR